MLDRTAALLRDVPRRRVKHSRSVIRAIDGIRVGKRHRRDLGDIAGLAQEIAELGLLHPIVVNHKNQLIAGVRRLEACKLLGLTDIAVTVVNLTDITRGELSENATRKDFLPSEIDAIRRTLEPKERAAARERRRARLKRGHKKPIVETFHNGGSTRDKIAAFTGVSGRTLDKIKAVVDAAKKDPERFGRLLVEMDCSGKVDRSYYELKRINVEQAHAVPITGRPDSKIITGDFRELGHVVQDSSVDLMFTDPLYRRKAIPLYADLAKFAERVLIEGGSLICYCGNYAIPEILTLMQPHLRYWWTVACVHTGGNKILPAFGVHIGWKPLLWFVKQKRRTHMVVGDCVRSVPGNKLTDHPWAQGAPEATYFIQRLSRKGSLVCDPFLGGATTAASALRLGRRFVGFEINPAVARKAKARIAHL
jgi:ParB family chromosome partitioning protein